MSQHRLTTKPQQPRADVLRLEIDGHDRIALWNEACGVCFDMIVNRHTYELAALAYKCAAQTLCWVALN